MHIAIVSYVDFAGAGAVHMHHFANMLVSRGRRIPQPYLNEIVEQTNRNLQRMNHPLIELQRSL